MDNEALNNRHSNHANEKEADAMPDIDLIEYERIAYIKEMQEYFEKLKKMNKKEAQEMSFQNLVNSGILTPDGRFPSRGIQYMKNLE